MAKQSKAPEVQFDDACCVTGPVTEPGPRDQVLNTPESPANEANPRNTDIGPGGIDLSGIPTHIDGRPLNMRARLDILDHQQAKARMAKIEEQRHRAPDPPKPHSPQPVAPAIRAQTEREIAAGRAVSAAHAAQQATRTYKQKPEPWEPTNTPVYRPGEAQRQKTVAQGQAPRAAGEQDSAATQPLR